MASTATRQRRPFPPPGRWCESWKVSYANREAALDGAERGMEVGAVSPGCHLTPYACEDCGRWHVANRRIVPVRRRR